MGWTPLHGAQPAPASVSAPAGCRDRCLRLLHRRHGLVAAAVCAVLHRTGDPAGSPGRRHRQPERPVGHPAGPQPAAGAGRTGPTGSVHAARSGRKFCRSFDDVFSSEGGKVLVTPVQAPKANAYAERWVRTVRAECLDWLLVVGRSHLEQVLRVYVQHYNRHRPHRALMLCSPDPLARPTILARTTDASVDATFSAACFTSTGKLHERLYAPHRVRFEGGAPEGCPHSDLA